MLRLQLKAQLTSPTLLLHAACSHGIFNTSTHGSLNSNDAAQVRMLHLVWV
jgi:hypothetical protein